MQIVIPLVKTPGGAVTEEPNHIKTRTKPVRRGGEISDPKLKIRNSKRYTMN